VCHITEHISNTLAEGRDGYAEVHERAHSSFWRTCVLTPSTLRSAETRRAPLMELTNTSVRPGCMQSR
jgi:hypothetical protein